MFSILILIAQICHVIGALLYKGWFRDIDTRWMIFWAFVVMTIAAFLNYTFAMRWNLEIGIPDLVFLLFTDIVFNTVVTILIVLPLFALFAKVTPRKIEGTIFAFLTGTMNLGYAIISPAIGAWYNHQFVGVNKND